MSNYSFIYQYKIFEDFRIIVTSICINIIYITKLKEFIFLNVINTILTKIEMIIILLIGIEIFFKKCVELNAFLKYKIHILQLGNLNYKYKKTAKCINIFYIKCNFC